jgi:hypothetical protein
MRREDFSHGTNVLFLAIPSAKQNNYQSASGLINVDTSG